MTSPTLREWLATTPYLTATSQWLPDPSQIVTDFTFAQAPDDTSFQQVLYDDTYLLPGDVGARVDPAAGRRRGVVGGATRPAARPCLTPPPRTSTSSVETCG